MSKYIEQSKVNDEIVRVLEHTDCKDEYIDRVLMAIESLPTIEVSEDCISREWLKGHIEVVSYENEWRETETDKFVSWENIENAPSVVPKDHSGESTERR